MFSFRYGLPAWRVCFCLQLSPPDKLFSSVHADKTINCATVCILQSAAAIDVPHQRRQAWSVPPTLRRRRKRTQKPRGGNTLPRCRGCHWWRGRWYSNSSICSVMCMERLILYFVNNMDYSYLWRCFKNHRIWLFVLDFLIGLGIYQFHGRSLLVVAWLMPSWALRMMFGICFLFS